jgi:hypothetical protein
MKVIATTIGVAAVSCLLAGAAGATPASSLDRCQKTVKAQAAKFIAGYTKAVETCLQKVSTRIVALNEADATMRPVPARRRSARSRTAPTRRRRWKRR